LPGEPFSTGRRTGVRAKLLADFLQRKISRFLDRQKNWSEGKTTRGFPPEKNFPDFLSGNFA